MRQELGRVLHVISLQIQREPKCEIRWDAHAIWDYARRLVEIRDLSPQHRTKIWLSLAKCDMPAEEQWRLKRHNSASSCEEFAWLLNFMEALDEVKKINQGNRLPLPVGYDSATREFLFEWITPKDADEIVEAAHEKKSLKPGVLLRWLENNSSITKSEKALFAQCFWLEDSEHGTETLLKQKTFSQQCVVSAVEGQPVILPEKNDQSSPLVCKSRPTDAMCIKVWRLFDADGREAFICSFHDDSDQVTETAGPYLTFREVDEELRGCGFIDSWTYFEQGDFSSSYWW